MLNTFIMTIIEEENLKHYTQQEFFPKFIDLTFSKADNPANVKTKYAINKIAISPKKRDSQMMGVCSIFLLNKVEISHLILEI